ncbi:lasso RiPP family leader peptide-containing protein [Micromonospora sp. C51]|uniref:lasso RiPP family leader peptide-containing protein n=1 Tax=Micromonospora sp. C51 TaxID=2824879 RepID=UPI0035AFF3BC
MLNRRFLRGTYVTLSQSPYRILEHYMSEKRIPLESGQKRDQARGYRAPQVERLGTLAELTRGGTGPIGDGQGGTGDSL